MTTPNTVDALAREISRWNFDATDTQLLVCKDQHDKCSPCKYETLHPAEAVRIIDELRSAVLEASARALAAMPAPTDLHAAIINLKAEASDKTIVQMGENPLLAYRLGHRDARHAAAELALNAPSPLAQQAGGVPAGFVLVPVGFLQGVHTLAHNYSLRAVPPDYYRGVEGDAFSNAYRRCGEDLAKLRAMLAAAPSPSAVQPLSEAQIEEARAWLWKNHSVSLSGKTIRDFVGIVTPKEPENGL